MATPPMKERDAWTDQKSKSQEKREKKEKKEKEEAKERKKVREEAEKKKKSEKKERDQEDIRNLEEMIRKATQEKKAIKRRVSLESADEMLILGEEDEENDEEKEERKEEEVKEGEKKVNKKTLEEVHLESMANKRLVAARPTRDDERWGDDQTMTYQSFRTNFKAASGSEGVNPRDILQEVIHWVRGVPKALVKNYMTAKDPEKGVKEMWEELDALYNLHILTAEERVKGILKKQKVAKENSGSHILLMAELKTLWREAEEDDMERQLDRAEIIRDIVMGRIPYIADEFYTKEGKKRVKDPSFRMKFEDLLEMVRLRAGTLKAQGIYSASVTTTTEKSSIRIAATTTGRFQGRTQEQTRSRPQIPRIPDEKCGFCWKDHQMEMCPRFLNMDVHTRARELRNRFRCYRCLGEGHRSHDCPKPVPRCGECGKDHITALHIPEETQNTRPTVQNRPPVTASANATTGNTGNPTNRA